MKIYNEREGAAMTKRTLEDRCDQRYLDRHEQGKLTHGETYVRAELDRLARQVRKLKDEGEWDRNYDIAINDVLALIKEAKVSTRKKLQARIDDRWVDAETLHAITVRHHIRAELDRLARQVRELRDTEEEMAFIVSYNKVLALLKEAKQ